MNNKELMSKIRQLRELKGFSQEAVSVDLSITPRAYSKLERGDTQLTVVRLYEISKILGLSPKEILGFEASNVFNNNPIQKENGSFIAYNNTEIAFVKDLYEKLIKEKDAVIALLRK